MLEKGSAAPAGQWPCLLAIPYVGQCTGNQGTGALGHGWVGWEQAKWEPKRPLPVVWGSQQVPNMTSVGVACVCHAAWAILVHRPCFSMEWSVSPKPRRKEGGSAR